MDKSGLKTGLLLCLVGTILHSSRVYGEPLLKEPSLADLYQTDFTGKSSIISPDVSQGLDKSLQTPGLMALTLLQRLLQVQLPEGFDATGKMLPRSAEPSIQTRTVKILTLTLIKQLLKFKFLKKMIKKTWKLLKKKIWLQAYITKRITRKIIKKIIRKKIRKFFKKTLNFILKFIK